MPEYPPDVKPYISYHQLSTYRRCPQIIHFWQTVPEESKIKDSRNAFVGSVVHNLAEMYLKGEAALKELYSLIPKVAAEFESSNPIVWRGAADKPKLRGQIPIHVAQLIHHLADNKITPDNSHSEHTIKVELPNLILAGRIDIVRKSNEPDYYTLYDIKATDRPNTVDHDQMLFYFLLASAAGLKIERGTFLHTKDGSKAVIERDEQLEANLMEDAVRIADHILAKQFGTTPGYWCSWCDYRKICPDARLGTSMKDDTGGPTISWKEW